MEGTLSPADIAVLSGNGRNGNDGFNDGGYWWIILLFLVFGWGRNGYGNGNDGSSGVADNYVLATDFATLERKLDGVNNGLCDGFYAQNTNMLNGFAGVQQTMCQGFSGVNQAIMTNGYETRNAINTVSGQLADCCCQNLRAIDQVNFNMATNTCGINNTINNSTRDIVDAVNCSFRALHEEIVANRIEDKNAQIQAQQNEINALRLRASQEAQNNYLISQLKPCPDPAYIVPNPNCCYSYTVSQNGCGC